MWIQDNDKFQIRLEDNYFINGPAAPGPTSARGPASARTLQRACQRQGPPALGACQRSGPASATLQACAHVRIGAP